MEVWSSWFKETKYCETCGTGLVETFKRDRVRYDKNTGRKMIMRVKQCPNYVDTRYQTIGEMELEEHTDIYYYVLDNS